MCRIPCILHCRNNGHGYKKLQTDTKSAGNCFEPTQKTRYPPGSCLVHCRALRGESPAPLWQTILGGFGGSRLSLPLSLQMSIHEQRGSALAVVLFTFAVELLYESRAQVTAVLRQTYNETQQSKPNQPQPQPKGSKAYPR